MFDLPPDLPRLRTLRTWHAMVVHELDQAIAAAEQQEAEQQRAAAHREARRQAVPDWTVSLSIGAGRDPFAVHVGDCHMQGRRTRAVTRDEALRLIADGVDACGHCRSDTALGLL